MGNDEFVSINCDPRGMGSETHDEWEIPGMKMLDWFIPQDIGGVAAVTDFFISVIGFGLAVRGSWKAQTAAEQAAEAARAARDAIGRFDTLVDFSAAITTLDEIKRMHRQGDSWALLPDRYSMIRKLLVQLRSSNVLLNDDQKSVIQNALTNLVEIEKQVERALDDPTTLKPAKFNAIISDDIDRLMSVLTQLKIQENGGSP